jgi:peptidoglycan/LPS O-acetylase OafA/YrhL
MSLQAPVVAADERAVPSTRLAPLDGIRGLAALVVLVHHCLLVVPVLAAPDGAQGHGDFTWFVNSPLHLVWAGGEAVVVFFVLSGIVLTLPVLRARPFDWLAYYPARLLRLYLPVIASVLLAAAVTIAIQPSASESTSSWFRHHDTPVTPSRMLHTSVLVFGTEWLNSPLWSLRWEVLFSLLLPVYVIVYVRILPRPLGVALAVALVFVGSGIGKDNVFYLSVFALGVLLARDFGPLRDRLTARISGRGGGWWVVGIGAFTVVTLTWRWTFLGLGMTGISLWWRAMAALGAVTLILLAATWPSFGRFLARPACQWAGRLSFSLYLTHEPIVVAVGRLVPGDLTGLVPVIAIPIALVVAYVFYRAVERPGHRLARWTGRRAGRFASTNLSRRPLARNP